MSDPRSQLLRHPCVRRRGHIEEAVELRLGQVQSEWSDEGQSGGRSSSSVEGRLEGAELVLSNSSELGDGVDRFHYSSEDGSQNVEFELRHPA